MSKFDNRGQEFSAVFRPSLERNQVVKFDRKKLRVGLEQVLLCLVSSLSVKKARQTNKPRIQRLINGLRMPLKATV
jgi:hypothetical protein